MKQFLKVFSGILVMVAIVIISQPVVLAGENENEAKGLVHVYLENKCSSNFKVYAKQPGQATYYTVESGNKKPFSFNEGTKLYNENDKLIAEITTSMEGKTIVLCH